MHPERIKAELRMRDWTYRRIAARLGIDPSTVSHVVSARRSERVQTFIAGLLRKRPEDLWPERYGRKAA